MSIPPEAASFEQPPAPGIPPSGGRPAGGAPPGSGTPPEDMGAPEMVWTYRGYRLRVSEFATAMVHLFRAEVSRANAWRLRLDTTTNWAVVTTGACVSIAFSQSATNHVVIILNALLVTMFLTIEARRYRYYELWAYRVRLMETDFFASMLVPPFHPSPDWAEALSESLLHPHFPISNLEAIGRRLRRNYFWIYIGLLGAWMLKLWLQPGVTTSWHEFIHRAAIGPIQGESTLIVIILFYIGLLLLALGTITMRQAAGEVLPRYSMDDDSIPTAHPEKQFKRAWFRPSYRRPQLLTFIITDRAAEVSQNILREMRRGVTSIDGTGMYTGKSHQVLMCALTVTEVPQLRSLVSQADPNAFVIVSPAQEVFGQGFMPLSKDEERS